MADDNEQSGSSGVKHALIGGVIVAVVAVALFAPIMNMEKKYTEEEQYPAEETYTEQVPREVETQEAVSHNVISENFDEEYLGLGNTNFNVEIRNTDTVGGQFNVEMTCETSSGNQIQLNPDSQYIQAGNVQTITGSTESSLERCNYEVNPPSKTVTETVMREVTRTRQVTKTREVTKTKTVKVSLVKLLTK